MKKERRNRNEKENEIIDLLKKRMFELRKGNIVIKEMIFLINMILTILAPILLIKTIKLSISAENVKNVIKLTDIVNMSRIMNKFMSEMDI